MRVLAGLLLIAACGANDQRQFDGTKTYDVGAFTLAPNQEIASDCVQITLDNEHHANVSVVELTAGPAFHSSWFYVPESVAPGKDGRYYCACDQTPCGGPLCPCSNPRALTQRGDSLFTSAHGSREVQQFAPGAVVRIPPRHKLVSQLYLLNATPTPVTVEPTLALTFVPDDEVTSQLAPMQFVNSALALPPSSKSRFVVECNLTELHRDSKLHYARAHYHRLGTRLSVEAVRATGESSLVYASANLAGDERGAMLDPPFDFTGYAKLRLSCDYDNDRATTVRSGLGDLETCRLDAFSDSTSALSGGAFEEEPHVREQIGDTTTFTNPCSIFEGIVPLTSM